MIRVNLLPEELRKKERIRITLPDLPIRGTLIVFFALFFVAQVGLSVYAFILDSKIMDKEEVIDGLSDRTVQEARRKLETGALRLRLQEIDALTERKFYWSKLLNSFSDTATRGIWFRSLSIKEVPAAGPDPAAKAAPATGKPPMVRTLLLEGSAVGQGQETAHIGKFIQELKEHPFLSQIFDDVQLSTINQKKVRDIDVYDFALVCIFNKEVV